MFLSFTSAGQSQVHVTWPLTTSLTRCNLGRLKVFWAIFTAKKAAGTLDKKKAWATGGGNIEMLFWCFFLCKQGDGQLAPWHNLLWLGKLLRGAAARCGFQATFTSRRECPSQELLCFYHVVAIYARLIFRQVQQLLIMPNKENAWEASAILHFEERRRVQEEADEKWLGRCAVATYVPFQKSRYTTIIFLVLGASLLGGGFKYCLYSPLLGEMIHFD